MSELSMYHNPRCSKSREALELLTNEGVEVETIDYINNPPTRDELKALLKKLGLKAADLVRKNEPVYAEKYKNRKMTSATWITAMMKNPRLIQRPILISEDQAIIGRPPELVIDFAKK